MRIVNILNLYINFNYRDAAYKDSDTALHDGTRAAKKKEGTVVLTHKVAILPIEKERNDEQKQSAKVAHLILINHSRPNITPNHCSSL